MYRFIVRCSAPVNRLMRLHRALNRRRGRTLTPVPLVVGLGLRGRVERVERARVVALPWRERVVYTRRGWRWQPPSPNRPAHTYVRVVDARGRLPDDPRVTSTGGYMTPRYGWVATGELRVSDLTEVNAGRPDIRQWVAPDGTTYIYNKGIEPGDPYTFEVRPPNRVRVADTSGSLPDDPRIIPGIGHDTVRYGRVAVGYLDVSDLTEVDTGRRDVRKWLAPDGTVYLYDKGLTPGDPYFFNVYPPRAGGEEAGDE